MSAFKNIYAWAGLSDGEVLISIADTPGRLQMEEHFKSMENISLHLDVSGLSRGVYIYRLISDNGTKGGKFIKQ